MLSIRVYREQSFLLDTQGYLLLTTMCIALLLDNMLYMVLALVILNPIFTIGTASSGSNNRVYRTSVRQHALHGHCSRYSGLLEENWRLRHSHRRRPGKRDLSGRY